MKKFYAFFVLVIAVFANICAIAAPKVTLTTTSIAASNLNQGSTSNVIYAVKMSVTVSAVTVNNIKFTLSGNHDNNDITSAYIYYNATSPVISGASYLGSATTSFAAPHTYSVPVNRAMVVGEQGYYIIVVNLSATATDNHTIQINGATNPVIFGYSVATTVTNSQSNAAGLQTIQAADVTLTSSAVPAANLNQGSTSNIVYTAKMKVVTEPVTVNNIQFTLSGNHDNNDITSAYIYYNATSPVISGASYLGSATTTFAAPHTYSVPVNRAMIVGEQGYYIIVVNLSATATDNHTIQINGATNPVIFGFTTAPNVTNSQTNNGGLKTIQAADITLTSSSVPAANLNQGSTSNIVYTAKMKVVTEPVTVNNIQFTLSGNHDNNDITSAYIYYNATSPVISGASYLGSATTTFAAPHTYSVPVNRAMIVGEQGYYIIVVNLSATATDNHTIQINGATNPVIFGFTTAPNVTNSQTNNGGLKTIQAADITLTSSAVAAGNIAQGSTSNIVYTAKMKVVTEPVTVNNIQFTLSGTHDNNDITSAYIYYNATSPVISGASYLGSATTSFAAPHTYSVPVNRAMIVGEQGYYIIVVNLSATATDNHTIQINGATNPVIFGFTTAPNVTNSQTNNGGLKTIQAADITLTSSAVAAGNIAQGSTSNIVYTAKMKVVTEPVTVNNIQFTLSGTHDNNDITSAYIYYNATSPVISGASYLGSATTNFAAPHTYSVPVNRAMIVGEQGYYIITVNVSASASVGKTVKINGSTDPIVFAYTTAPNSTNSQTNNGGTKTISASFSKTPVADNETNAIGNNSFTLKNVFPNPASSTFSFSVSGNKNEKAVAQLTDRSGNKLVQKSVEIISGSNQYSMNVSSFMNGVYYLVITNASGEAIAKQQIIIQH